jgi:hypothetical protein
MSKKMVIAVVMCLCVAGASQLASGETIRVDDHFDDGAIGTNTNGIGTGFNSGAWSGGAVITEAETTVTLENSEVAWARVAITSKEGADIGPIARFEFRGVSFSQSPNGWDWGGNTDRLAIGVKNTTDAVDYDAGLWAGFYIQFESDSIMTGNNAGFNGTSILFYRSVDGVNTPLATWSFDTLNWDDWANQGAFNFTPVLNLILDISATEYSLTIEGDTVTLLSGSLDGSFDSAGITNELTTGYAFAYAQTENPSLFTSIDQIIITEDVATKIQFDAPENGENYVPIDQQLSWIVMEPAVEYIDLYFGTENDPNLSAEPANKRLSMEPAATVTWDPGLLGYATTYYWRVDAYEPNTAPGATDYILTPGSVWKFTSVGQSATVAPVSPAKTVVDAGTASITLSVTAHNATSFQWYKDDTALTDGADFSGTATRILTIYDVQQADEGWYYCQVDNDLPETVPADSVPGLVMTKRVIIHYPLDTVYGTEDGFFTPDVIGGFDMQLMTEGVDYPSPVSGVTELGEGGQALLFNNLDPADPNVWGQYATAGDVDMEALGNGLTIAFWVKWTENNTNWQGIINRRGTWAADNMMWRIDKSPSSGEISFERASGAGRVATSLVQGNWHYIVATYDIASDATKMYNNGVRMSTGTGFTYGTGSNSGFKLGSNNDDGSEFFCGMIDDVKIYNYAISAAKIAQDYANVMSVSVCNREGTADMQFDTNDDCKIDITDFAQFALDWLNDNRIYPQ